MCSLYSVSGSEHACRALHGCCVASPQVRPLATGEYTWRIEGLSLDRLRAYPPGKHLESPPFSVDDTQFYLRLFPAGDGREESKGHVSAFLHIKTAAKKVVVDFELSVLNQSNALMFAREQARARPAAPSPIQGGRTRLPRDQGALACTPHCLAPRPGTAGTPSPEPACRWACASAAERTKRAADRCAHFWLLLKRLGPNAAGQLLRLCCS